ncbi:MAG: calcineurin-like phosphoesterase C-terminal domain-containing protein, partial [Kiloniellales bacterium]
MKSAKRVRAAPLVSAALALLLSTWPLAAGQPPAAGEAATGEATTGETAAGETATGEAATGETAAGEIAAGVVFEDLNGNGARDGGEPGIAGVSVSNGREVVQSGPGGGYSLPVAEGNVLFITKPAGYAVPLGKDNLPRFHYIHDPDGTPAEFGLRFGGVAPTGALPDSIDFPLAKSPEPDDFKVIWFADTQAQTPAELDYLRDDVVAELVGTDAVFGITAGDVIYDDLTLYPRHNGIIGRIGIPWYNVPGNHDLNFLSPDDRHSLETFKRTYGPTYYSFDYGQVHFVMLDSVVYHGRNAGRSEPNAWGAGTYEGRISQVQLDWLANDLSFVPADKLVVVGMHIQLHTPGPDNPTLNVANREALFALLSGREHVFSIAGHWQSVLHRYFGPEDGFTGPEPLHQHVIAAASGGWWSGPLDTRGIPIALQADGTPNGYYIMSVRGRRATMRFKAASEPADYQMRITIAPVFEHPTMGPAAPQGFDNAPIP